MNRKKVQVEYHLYYDLVFRAKTGKLGENFYVVEFFDWIRAGIAFNTRGSDVSTRKIANFVNFYNHVIHPELNEQDNSTLLRAIRYFYEDTFLLYQTHLKSQQVAMLYKERKLSVNLSDLAVIPSFDLTPGLKKYAPSQKLDCNTYVCKHLKEFREEIIGAPLKEDTTLFKSMSILYDYGTSGKDTGTILEVNL